MEPIAHLDLVREELRDQVDEVMDRRAAEPFGLYAGIREDQVAELARVVERVVFGETFGNTPEFLAQEYGVYEASSLFFCVIDHRRRLPVGMMRCILPSAAGFKSLDDIGREWDQDVDTVLARTGMPFDRREAWDCATVATISDYRKGALQGLVATSLYQSAATATYRFGYRWWVTILDWPVYRLMQWKLGRPFSFYEGVEAGPYLGSESSIPVWADIDEWTVRLFHKDPEQFELLFGGAGLAGAVKALDWDQVEALARALAPDGPFTRSVALERGVARRAGASPAPDRP